jgi:alkanesulfonate monooxygenase
MILKQQAWTRDEINHDGEVYQFANVPAAHSTTKLAALLYFSGYSPAALELCGQHCDVYLMWP